MKTFGIRHSDRVSAEEVSKFREKVKSFLEGEKIPYKKLVALTSFGGQVKIFSGGIQHRLRLRMGRKLVAFKNPDGTIEGTDSKAIEKLKVSGGDYMYEQTNEPIPELAYHPVYMQDNWEGEKASILDWSEQEAKK